MFMMKGGLALFASLAIGYVLCILARREKGILRTLGYTLGIATIVLSLLYGAFEGIAKCHMMGKFMCGQKAMKCQGTNFVKGQIR